MTEMARSPKAEIKTVAGAAFLLGFALGGFFDGILLHQVLQWHHLLSTLEARGPPFADLRFQLAADGYFHLLMYVIAALALWFLWRGRRALYKSGAGRRLSAWLLIGFGLWHVVDAVASHWVAQIHRIRMDAENPLLWDIGWLVVFGAIPLAVGLWLRTGRRDTGSTPQRGASLLAMLTLVTGGAAIWSAQRPPGADYTILVFAPGVSFDRGVRLSQEVGELVWFSGDGVYLVKDAAASAWQLYGRGALLVGGAGTPAGCGVWAQV